MNEAFCYNECRCKCIRGYERHFDGRCLPKSMYPPNVFYPPGFYPPGVYPPFWSGPDKQVQGILFITYKLIYDFIS